MSAEESTATLLIGAWDTRCSNCKRSVDLYSIRHEVNLGWGSENGTPGCGALFTAAIWTYNSPGDGARRLRPDLFPPVTTEGNQP